MSGENLVLLNSSINEITLQTTVNSIVISGSLNPTTVIVPQPVTTTVEVATVGPQGPQGPQGLVTSFLITGSVTASLDTTGSLFTLSSESSNILRVDSTGSIFLKNQLPTTVQIKPLADNEVVASSGLTGGVSLEITAGKGKVTAGPSPSAGNGGSLILKGGDGYPSGYVGGGAGGNVLITAGQAGGSGLNLTPPSPGYVRISSDNGELEVNEYGVSLTGPTLTTGYLSITGEQLPAPQFMPAHLITCFIEGMGSTSATTNLLLQNSSTITLLSVKDNGAVNIPGSLTSPNITGSILNLTPVNVLPSSPAPCTFAVSASSPPKPYFYDGVSWNALY